MSLAPPLPITLDVPFADTSSDQLRFSLTRPRLPALATETVDLEPFGLPGLRLGLHVIGSSHQVALTGSDDQLVGPDDHLTGSDDHLIETFACPPSEDDPAPPATATGAPRWGEWQETRGAWAGFTRHGFRATRTAVAEGFRTSVAEALDRVRAHDRHLVVGFPGDPDALTALALTGAESGRLSWQTWHVYPQHTEIVRTATTLTCAPASARGGLR
ncbi:DUF2617 family protein [Brevibacterium casei]|uniref:DUF2617 domain-containing protein n=1 Tax=Brevibacterium casei TaxID=33889 RepID=A0AB34XMB2_9MICO|nr:DUF2617 family protein [Brevibacterium casei]KZE12142.1 hypothetical protein AVW13_16410 [Brevibacterium casei]SIH12767.1 Protein of uncharacterised function DUF2617 [Mycobacteroides abscessus subsp. abscessus]